MSEPEIELKETFKPTTTTEALRAAALIAKELHDGEVAEENKAQEVLKTLAGTEDEELRPVKKEPRKPRKVGRPNSYLSEMYSADTIRGAKVQILEILGAGQAKTLTAAANLIGIAPTRVYSWKASDKDFRECLKMVDEVIADGLEDILMESRFPVAQIFLLKGFRPEKYRDNYRFEVTTPKMEQDLEELRKLGKGEAQEDAQPQS